MTMPVIMAVIREKSSEATYILCFADSLNLAIVMASVVSQC